MTSLHVIAAAAVLSLLAAAPVSAQTSSGGIASANVSAMSIEGGTSASFAGAVGYRFNPVVAVGVEMMFVPSLTSETPDIPAIPTPLSAQLGGFSFPSPNITISEDGGHASIFTTHLRLTIPTRSRRISPYVIGGAGVGTITDRIQYSIVYPDVTLISFAGQPVNLPGILAPLNRSIDRTTTDFAATFGGGVSFLTGGQWSFDVDARYIGIFGRRDAHIGRYGGGVTFRF